MALSGKFKEEGSYTRAFLERSLTERLTKAGRLIVIPFNAMKVFISWSGEYSKGVAEAIYEFLPDVVQAFKPWMASESIRKGNRWLVEVTKSLEEINFGILCLTPDNVDAAWINFEAGALGKNITNPSIGVVGLLFDLNPTDFSGPLTQFQNAVFSRDEMLKLVKEMNNKLQEPVEIRRLERSFEQNWPILEKNISEVRKGLSEKVKREKKKEDRELLEEILELLRNMSRRSASTSRLENVATSIANLLKTNRKELMLELLTGCTTYKDIAQKLTSVEGMDVSRAMILVQELKEEMRGLKVQGTLPNWKEIESEMLKAVTSKNELNG